jgi:hypothetical protein
MFCERRPRPPELFSLLRPEADFLLVLAIFFSFYLVFVGVPHQSKGNGGCSSGTKNFFQ